MTVETDQIHAEAMRKHWGPAEGCSDYRMFPNSRDACILRFVFTYAIIADLERWGYGDRWCYDNYEEAKAALDAWDGEGEPQGWHRHPDSGRRRPQGDAAQEYINP